MQCSWATTSRTDWMRLENLFWLFWCVKHLFWCAKHVFWCVRCEALAFNCRTTYHFLPIPEALGEEGEMIASDMVKDDEVIPFPHESHPILTQELLHIFHAGVLIAVGIGAGLSVLGGLLAGARVVAVTASKAHQRFVERNIFAWLKEKKVVPGTLLPKPMNLLQWEQKKGKPTPTPPRPPASGSGGTPSPAPSPAPTPSPAPSPSPAPTPNNGNSGGPGKNLLAAFGNAAMWILIEFWCLASVAFDDWAVPVVTGPCVLIKFWCIDIAGQNGMALMIENACGDRRMCLDP